MATVNPNWKPPAPPAKVCLMPKVLSENEAGFYQGFAVAIAFLIHSHGEDSLAIDAMICHGITLQDLVDAGCDESELDTIRPAWESSSKTKNDG